MPLLHYGLTIIDWQFQPDAKLKRHYVTVERERPVLLRGPAVDLAEQQALIRRRAHWIREKLMLVNQQKVSDAIVTGSRLSYCGRSYFTEVRHTPDVDTPRLTFTASRFIIECPVGMSIQSDTVASLVQHFYRERANERLLPRVRHWERRTGLQANGARVRVFQSRWASCDAQNTLEFHPRVMELPGNVQDYIIVHELCHTVEKSHTKAFWTLVSTHLPEWERLHKALELGWSQSGG